MIPSPFSPPPSPTTNYHLSTTNLKKGNDMNVQEEIHAMGVKARAAAGSLRAFTTE